MFVRNAWVAVLLFLVPTASRAGTYCGAVGTTGCTAIAMDDPSFVEWATDYLNYSVGANCATSWQTPAKALGKAVGSSYDIVCLGDGGQITLTFDKAITNGAGYDFAVFENSFSDTFLDLGYVEVSSDGVNFFRFDNDSLTATAVSSFGSVDPTSIDGLAGKYRQGYGTPFDLNSLAGRSSLLDLNNVRYVKIADIVGDGTYKDTSGDAIYDPYPCSGSAGFDLDAVGAIHVIPEPSTFIMMVIVVLAVAGIAYRQWRRRLRQFILHDSVISFQCKSNPTRSIAMSPICSDTWRTAAAFLLTVGSLTAEARAAVITFDELGQGPNACTIDGAVRGYYWSGSDGSGRFASGGASFNNSHSYGTWSGWAYSNVNYTDTSAPDYTHQYAAVTGAGVGGDGNYALGFGCSSCIELFGGVLPTITIPEGMKVESASFTNTTYAAASMLHGDGFAKKFTTSDWLKLTITGEDALGASIGAVDFYLARNGSVVTSWESLDLRRLVAARTLEFDLTSSDTGSYGMNTPAYFAMDNLTLSAVPEPSAILLLGGAGAFGAFWFRIRRSDPHAKTIGGKVR